MSSCKAQAGRPKTTFPRPPCSLVLGCDSGPSIRGILLRPALGTEAGGEKNGHAGGGLAGAVADTWLYRQTPGPPAVAKPSDPKRRVVFVILVSESFVET